MTTDYALHKSRAVLASAGTGKTYTLVETYVGLLVGLDGREPLRPSQILALTFTDRAASQMRQRVLARVRELRHPGEKRDAWLKDNAGRAKLVQPDELARLEPQVMSAPICTFHSFCGRLLKEFAAQCGMPLSPSMLDGPTSAQLLSEACLEALAASMNDNHRDATLALVEEMGLSQRTGILTALEDVQKRMGERGLSVEELELCAKPAVAEMRFEVLRAVRAIQALLGMPVNKTEKHRESAQKLEELIPLLVDNRDEDEVLGALAQAYRIMRAKWGNQSIADAREEVKVAIRRAVGAWSLQQSLRVGALFKGLLLRASRAYAQRKKELGALDFTDMLVGARDLLRNHYPVRVKLQDRYGAVLVDEMQDTSPIQAELLMLLMDRMEVPPESLRFATVPDGRLLIVGDRKQSIYGFRGADVSLFDEAREAVTRTGGEQLFLRASRRSTPTMVKLLNHLSARALGPGFSTEDELTPVKEGGVAVPGTWVRVNLPRELQENEHRKLEAQALAQHMRKVLDGGAQPSECVVLLRTRSNAEVYRSALEAAGVPARMGRGGSLLDRPEVQDALALLTLVADPTNTHALATALRSPMLAFRDEALVVLSLIQCGGKLDGMRVLAQKLVPDADRLLWPQEKEALQKLKETIVPLVADGPAMDAGYALCRVWDALDGWAAVELHDDGAARAANIRALEMLLRGRSVPDAVRYVREAERANIDWPLGLPEGVVNQVTILTIHEAKGLEYRIVALADMCSGAGGIPPPVVWHPRQGLAVRCADHVSGALDECDLETAHRFVNAALRADADEETNRLLYVALTRAEEQLIFSGETRDGKGARPGTFAHKLYDALEGAVKDGLVDVVKVDSTLPLPVVPRMPVPMSVDERPVVYAPTGRPSSMDVDVLADAIVCPRRYALMHLEPFQREPYLHPDDAENPVLTAQMREILSAAVTLAQVPPDDEVRPSHVDGALRGAGMVAAQIPEAQAAQLRSELGEVLASPLYKAMRLVPVERAWTDLSALVEIDGTTVTGRIPFVVEGTQGEPWMMVQTVRESSTKPLAHHQARMKLHALMVSGGADAQSVRSILCYAQQPPARFFLETWSTVELEAFRKQASDVLVHIGDIKKRPLPDTLPRTACVERGCGFVNVCHGR